MNIAIDLTPLYNRKWTGIEYYGIELYNAIKDLDIDVYPIFRMENPIDNNPNTIIIKRTNRLVVENILLSKVIRQLNVNVVLFPIFPPPIDIYWGNKIKIIPTIHDLAFKHYTSTLSFGARFYIKPKLNLALKKANKIVTISNTVKEELMFYTNKPILNWGENISKIYLNVNKYIDRALLKKWNLKENEYFISVSTIEPRKNFKYLLQIMKEYKQDQNNAKLVLVGRRGWGKDRELDALIMELGTSVSFTEYVSEKELITLYHYSKAFFLLSMYEGFGRTPLEALACGARVFVSDIPVFKETLGDSVTYLPLNSISECVGILKNIDLREPNESRPSIPFTALEDNLRKENMNDLLYE